MSLDTTLVSGIPVNISWASSVSDQSGNPVGGFSFGRAHSAGACLDGLMPLDMPVLGALADSGYEIWLSSCQTKFNQKGNVRYVEEGATIFGYVCLPEAPNDKLEDLTYNAYLEVLQFIRSSGSRHLWRLWNYFSGINDDSSGLERYRAFNVGRQRAFDTAGDLLEAGMPAASAVGTHKGGLSIAFLAGAVPARLVENPRQMSAYQYPEQYGPRSPSFSRAGLVQVGQSHLLLVSGTASIIGHESVHVSNPQAQTLTALENIQLVIAEAEKLAERPIPMHALLYRVYVRNERDYDHVCSGFAEFFQGAPMPLNVHYVLGDICRSDLLVEIEASGCVA